MQVLERATRFVVGKSMDLVERGITKSPLLGRPLAQPPTNARPVILMSGYGNTEESMTAIGRSLKRDGFRDVYHLPAPEHGMASARVGVNLLDDLIRNIKATTGAKEVDIVAHSRNGQVARNYVQENGPGDVRNLVLLTSANHGIPLGPLEKVAPQGLRELSSTGPLIRALNKGPDMTPPGVNYTTVSTGKLDWVMFPASTGQVPADSNAVNVIVDKGRTFGPFSKVSHFGVLKDDKSYEAIRTGLQRA